MAWQGCQVLQVKKHKEDRDNQTFYEVVNVGGVRSSSCSVQECDLFKYASPPPIEEPI